MLNMEERKVTKSFSNPDFMLSGFLRKQCIFLCVTCITILLHLQTKKENKTWGAIHKFSDILGAMYKTPKLILFHFVLYLIFYDLQMR